MRNRGGGLFRRLTPTPQDRTASPFSESKSANGIGTARPLVGSEGRDLFNLGGAAKGHGLLTAAFGARYKFNETFQLGAAYEFPVAGPRDFFSSRVVLDFIVRY